MTRPPRGRQQMGVSPGASESRPLASGVAADRVAKARWFTARNVDRALCAAFVLGMFVGPALLVLLFNS